MNRLFGILAWSSLLFFVPQIPITLLLLGVGTFGAIWVVIFALGMVMGGRHGIVWRWTMRVVARFFDGTGWVIISVLAAIWRAIWDWVLGGYARWIRGVPGGGLRWIAGLVTGAVAFAAYMLLMPFLRALLF